MRLDHGAHLTIEEAVGESDEEALEWEEPGPGEDEDGGQGGAGGGGTHDGDQIGDAEQRNYDDQSLGRPQIYILSGVMNIIGPQLGDHDLTQQKVEQCEEILKYLSHPHDPDAEDKVGCQEEADRYSVCVESIPFIQFSWLGSRVYHEGAAEDTGVDVSTDLGLRLTVDEQCPDEGQHQGSSWKSNYLKTPCRNFKGKRNFFMHFCICSCLVCVFAGK